MRATTSLSAAVAARPSKHQIRDLSVTRHVLHAWPGHKYTVVIHNWTADQVQMRTRLCTEYKTQTEYKTRTTNYVYKNSFRKVIRETES